MIAFTNRVSKKLSEAIAEGRDEPAIVERFTHNLFSLNGTYTSSKVGIRSKFIHQRPYVIFVAPTQFEGGSRTELGDILFIIKEKHNGIIWRKRLLILQVKIVECGLVHLTPHTTFCRPILEVLVEMGGDGKTKAVLDRVGEKMKGILKPKDYEKHQSSGNQIRWRNTAQWARNTMVNDDGRMKKGSRNGYWEISDKGRAWLKKPV